MARLDACTRIVSGATPATGVQENWDGDIKWVTPRDLSDLDSIFISDTPRKITKAGLASCSAEMLPANSVLFSSRAPIGHVAINSEPMATNQGFKSFVPNSTRLRSDYLYWWLKANRTYLESLGNGATFKEISKAVIARIEIPLPPLDEQRRIAAILDQADALRRKRSRASEKLGMLPEAIFIEMFGLLYGNHTSQNSKLDELGRHLSFVTSGGRNWSAYYSDSGSRFIRSYDVQMNYVGDQEPIFVNPPKNAEAKRTMVESGDVLLTITGSRIGRVAPISPELAGAYVSQHVAILRPNDTLLPEFLSTFLSLPLGGQLAIAKSQYGQTKPGLNFDQIRQFKVPVPDVSLQAVFVEQAKQVAGAAKRMSSQAVMFDALFASLQHRAFNGELTAKVAERELADVG